MPTKEGEELLNGMMYIKDSDGQIVPIPRSVEKIEPGQLFIEGDDQPEFIIPPEYQGRSFTITGKTADRIIRMILHDLDVLEKRKRSMLRKKEQYRRACLKYPSGHRKRELAYLLWQVAIERYLIWKGEGHYGNEKVPAGSCQEQA